MSWLWPFTTKDTSQFQRVDQGWDLQQADKGGAIVAVDSGTVGVASDPTGFGPDYPTLALDAPPAGAPSRSLYYGHADVEPALVGQHVQAGQVIGHTAPGGHNSPGGWLEIGFAKDGTGAPAAGGGGFIKSLLTGTAASPGVSAIGGTLTSATAAGSSSGISGFGKLGMELAMGGAGLLLIVVGAKRFSGSGK